MEEIHALLACRLMGDYLFIFNVYLFIQWHRVQDLQLRHVGPSSLTRVGLGPCIGSMGS